MLFKFIILILYDKKTIFIALFFFFFLNTDVIFESNFLKHNLYKKKLVKIF